MGTVVFCVGCGTNVSGQDRKIGRGPDEDDATQLSFSCFLALAAGQFPVSGLERTPKRLCKACSAHVPKGYLATVVATSHPPLRGLPIKLGLPGLYYEKNALRKAMADLKKGLWDKAVIIKSSDLVEFHMEHNHRDRLRNSIMARIQKLEIHETQLTVAQHQKRKEVRQLLAAARDDLDKIDQQGPHILGNFHKIMALGRSVTGTSPSTAGCLDRIGLGGVVEQMIGVKNGFVDLMLESVFIISIAWVAELSKLIREATSEIEMDGRTLWAIMSQIDLVSPTAKVHTRSHVHSSGTLLGLAKAGAGGGSDAVLGQACSKMSARNFASSGQPNYLKDVTRDQLQYETMPEKYRQVLDQSPTVERYGTGSYWDFDKYMENFGIAPAKAQIKTPHLSTVHDEVALLAVYSGMTNAWYKNLGGVEWGGDVPAYHA